jgi:hypothetical protein
LRNAFFCTAFHNLRRADRARARGRGRALCGGRALHIRATRSGARRALTALLFTGTTINDDRLRLGHGALEDILAEIRCRGALGFKHILAHIRHSRARRNRALQDIFRQVRLSTRWAGRADRALRTTPTTGPVVSTARAARIRGNFSKFNSSKAFFGHFH